MLEWHDEGIAVHVGSPKKPNEELFIHGPAYPGFNEQV
jgi:hypothetical protein